MQYDRRRRLFPALEWSICYRHSFISSVGSPPLKGNQRSLAEGKSNCARGGDCVVLYLLLSPFISFYLLLLITDPTPAPPLQGRGTEVRWQREKQLLRMCQTVYTNKKWRSEQIVSFIFNDEAGKKECCCGTSFV